jgi:hypothetical protein
MDTAGEGTGPRSDGSRPAAQYGRRRRGTPSRPVLVLLAALVVAAGLVVAWLGYRNLGDPPIEGHLLSWRAAAGHLSVRFAVHRDHPERAAVCVLRARSRDGGQVGRVQVPVAAAAVHDVAVTADVAVTEPAVVAEVYSCSYQQ